MAISLKASIKTPMSISFGHRVPQVSQETQNQIALLAKTASFIPI
jgi:hypothetical protein